MNILTDSYNDEELEYFRVGRLESKAFQLWLSTQPHIISAVLAVRIGLRVLPFGFRKPIDNHISAKDRRVIALAFRFAALGWLSCICSDYRPPSIVWSLLTKAGYARGPVAFGAISEAAAAALPLSGQFRADVSKSYTLRAMQAATFSSSSRAGAPWPAITADKTWIETSGNPLLLLNEPAWLPNSDSEGQATHLSRWNLMRSSLEDDDPSWAVWIDWYDNRLRGAPVQHKEAECFRVTLINNPELLFSYTSREKQQEWEDQLDNNFKLLKNDPRKTNRLIANFLSQLA